MAVPLLVVVTGMPSSGKTTVAEGLAARLALPLIAKDEIKESLYESLGARDVAASRIGAAAYTLIFGLARTMLATGVSLIAGVAADSAYSSLALTTTNGAAWRG